MEGGFWQELEGACSTQQLKFFEGALFFLFLLRPTLSTGHCNLHHYIVNETIIIFPVHFLRSPLRIPFSPVLPVHLSAVRASGLLYPDGLIAGLADLVFQAATRALERLFVHDVPTVFAEFDLVRRILRLWRLWWRGRLLFLFEQSCHVATTIVMVFRINNVIHSTHTIYPLHISSQTFIPKTKLNSVLYLIVSPYFPLNRFSNTLYPSANSCLDIRLNVDMNLPRTFFRYLSVLILVIRLWNSQRIYLSAHCAH